MSSEKLSVVLGGTSGLGWDIVEQLRERGERVLVLGRTYSSDIHGDGLSVDLASENSVDAAVEQLRVKLGDQALKSFWWVSGYGYKGDFSEQEDPRRMAIVDYAGALPMAQFAWSEMLEQDGSGTFVTVASSTGLVPREDEAVYAGAKAAQVNFTRSLGMEAERLENSTRVTLLIPGGMQTPFWGDEKPVGYETFNDPAKVAIAAVDAVSLQTETFLEKNFPRGEYI